MRMYLQEKGERSYIRTYLKIKRNKLIRDNIRYSWMLIKEKWKEKVAGKGFRRIKRIMDDKNHKKLNSARFNWLLGSN